MTRSDLRLLIQESVYEAYTERPELLQEALINRMVEKVLKWLFQKLKSIDVGMYENIISLANKRDEEGLKRIFDDPRVKKFEKTINEVSQADGPAKKLKDIVSWIEKNKTAITVYAILGLISAVIGLVHAGSVPIFLSDILPKMAGSALAGTVGGLLVGAGSDAISQIRGTGSVKSVDWKDAIIAGADSAKRGLVAGMLAGPLGGVASTLFSGFGIGGIAGAKAIGIAAGGAASRLPELIKYIEDLPSGKKLLTMLYSRRDKLPHLKDKKEDIENWYNWAINDDQDGLVDSDLDHPDVKFALAKLLRADITDKEFESLKNFLDKQHGVVYQK